MSDSNFYVKIHSSDDSELPLKALDHLAAECISTKRTKGKTNVTYWFSTKKNANAFSGFYWKTFVERKQP